jgi:hypothetical protein
LWLYHLVAACPVAHLSHIGAAVTDGAERIAVPLPDPITARFDAWFTNG